MTPTVGLPLCLDEQERWKPGRSYHYVDAAYARAIERAGGVALYLPLQDDPQGLVARIDALLVPGGDDLLPPQPYPAHVRFDPVPPRQLAFDTALLAAALARGIPVLGICYGMQLLALARGGRLHYDLATDVPGAVAHRLGACETHPVLVEPGSRLAAITGARELRVSSRHHQAVSEPGSGLRVCARAADGVIEAIEAEDGFQLGVQWHPEGQDDAESEALFRAFVAAAEPGPKRRNTRAPRSAAKIAE
ncbi:MAG TPA: gamma-glutamyl-gamma-aminobutyrate hydrolase family protein [Myxococcota bacterium]|nr:gamma-glutamyl-gamma-aminobutyrate hydrolase family protein [Myxococcota bacterium]